MARGLAATLPGSALTVVGNVGDDEVVFGVHVAADLDTITYTLSGIEGEHGWGIADDTFVVLEQLGDLGLDVTFRLGDRDLATCLRRTADLAAGIPLSASTDATRRSLGVAATVLPATDDRLRTEVTIADGTRLSFQDYFVRRRHADEVAALDYVGAAAAEPAPGVIESIERARLVVIAPSNPPLSVWPILAISAIRDAVQRHPRVVAISPLFGGKALKGPADRVMRSLGLPPGNAGVLAAYEDLLAVLVIDQGDASDLAGLAGGDVDVRVTDTRIGSYEAGKRFATWLLDEVAP